MGPLTDARVCESSDVHCVGWRILQGVQALLRHTPLSLLSRLMANGQRLTLGRLWPPMVRCTHAGVPEDVCAAGTV